MTRKRHNCDVPRTEQANFLDPRSYWTNAGHEYLFGDDVEKRRKQVYQRDKGACQTCIRAGKTFLAAFVWWEYGEMHHIKGGNTDDRCWCMHNLEWICPAHHHARHVRPQFGVKVPA